MTFGWVQMRYRRSWRWQYIAHSWAGPAWGSRTVCLLQLQTPFLQPSCGASIFLKKHLTSIYCIVLSWLLTLKHSPELWMARQGVGCRKARMPREITASRSLRNARSSAHSSESNRMSFSGLEKRNKFHYFFLQKPILSLFGPYRSHFYRERAS